MVYRGHFLGGEHGLASLGRYSRCTLMPQLKEQCEDVFYSVILV